MSKTWTLYNNGKLNTKAQTSQWVIDMIWMTDIILRLCPPCFPAWGVSVTEGWCPRNSGAWKVLFSAPAPPRSPLTRPSLAAQSEETKILQSDSNWWNSKEAIITDKWHNNYIFRDQKTLINWLISAMRGQANSQIHDQMVTSYPEPWVVPIIISSLACKLETAFLILISSLIL